MKNRFVRLALQLGVLLVVGIIITFLTVPFGSPKPSWTYTPPPAISVIPTSVPVGKYGIGCRTVESPDLVGPASYLLSDVGKPGVPELTSEQRRMIERIRNYVRSPTLRFTFAGQGERFIIYDAHGDPCSSAAVGYWIMNDPGGNAFYQPGESPDDIHAGPGDISPTQGPWMR